MADIDPKQVKWDEPTIDRSQIQWDAPEKPLKPSQDYGQGVAKFANETGGAVVDYLSEKLGPGSPIAAGAGVATRMLLGDIPPMVMGGQVGAAVGAPVMQGAGKWLMQGALKPSAKHLASGKADKAVTTLLKEGVPVSRSGIETLKGKVGNLEAEIQSILNNSSGMVDKYAVGAALSDLVKKTQTNLSAADDIATIQSTLTKFLNHPILNNTTRVPASVANKIKQSIYKSVGENAYGFGARPAIEAAAEKGIAAGLRQQTAIAEPQIVPLLAQQEELLNALKVMQPRALIQGNVNPLGLALLAKNPAAAAGFALDRNAPVRSWLASQLYRNAAPVTGGAGALTPEMLGILSGTSR